MLNLKDVRAGYGNIQIVNGISMEVKEGKIVAIVGANGVGKSTLIKTIVGLLPIMGGQIFFEGEEITGLPTHVINARGISLVPEGRLLFPKMTVEENLDIGACTPKTRPLREQKKQDVFSLFPVLFERSKQIAGTLSGGEQQMLATARALMSNPKLLIMDEPSWGLAPLLVTEMFHAIEKIRDNGTSVLIIEQNVSKVLQVSDWGYVLEHGQVYMEGKGLELLKREDLKKAYLGI
ncbi:MAG: ABC transporter ATP-binding protein [Christensenellales bacterium]